MTDRNLQIRVGVDPAKAVSGFHRVSASVRLFATAASGANGNIRNLAAAAGVTERAQVNAFRRIGFAARNLRAELAKNIDQMRQYGDSAGKQFRSAGKSLAVAGGIAAPLAMAAKQAADFQKGLAEVATLISGKSLKQVETEFGPMILELSKRFGQAPEVVTKAAYQAISAGVEPAADAVSRFLTTAGGAAVGGVSDMETAVDGITSVVNAYGKETMSAGQASDLMFTAVKQGKTTFGELSQYLAQVIPTAAGLKVQFGDVTAAIATMTSQGTKTGPATSQLNQLMAELGKGNTEIAGTFRNLSGKSFPDFIAQGGTLQQALSIIEKHAVKNRKSMIDMFGSIEAGKAALQLTGRGAQIFSANIAAAAGSTGAAGEAFAKVADSTSFRWDKAKESFTASSIALGTALLPAINKAVDAVTPLIDRISFMIANDPAFVSGIIDAAQGFIYLFAAIAAVKTMMGIAYIAMAAFRGLVILWRAAAFAAMVVQNLWNIAMAIGFLPVLLVLIPVIAAVGLAIWALWKPIKFVFGKLSALFGVFGKLKSLLGGGAEMPVTGGEPAIDAGEPAGSASGAAFSGDLSLPAMPAMPDLPKSAGAMMPSSDRIEIKVEQNNNFTGVSSSPEDVKKMLRDNADLIAAAVSEKLARRQNLSYGAAR